jgi:putative transposase
VRRAFTPLAGCGVHVGKKRVARLMRAAGLVGISPRKSMFTTVRDPDARPSEDLVQRDFTASRPDQPWVADITYIPTWAGFLYLAVVIDAWSRKVVGWAMSTTLHTDVVLEALNMAVTQRQPRDVIHHSDHGCQYTSFRFGRRCKEAGVRPSMGTVGDAYDNAMWESFFGTLECESSTVAASARRPKRAWRCSTTSKASTTRGAGTRRSTTSHRWSTRGVTRSPRER